MVLARPDRSGAPEAHDGTRKTGLAAVNALAIELAALTNTESVPPCLSERLLSLTGAVVVAFNDYAPAARALTTTYIAAGPGVLGRVNEVIGRRMVGRKYPVGDDDLRMMLRVLIGYRKTLTEVTFGRVPEAAGRAVQAAFGVDRFLALTYAVGGELFGTSVLALRAGTPDPAPEMLEGVVSVGAVSLCRQRAENELQTLNAELERRVLQRTEELEVANRRLSAANRALADLNQDLEHTIRLLDDATRAKSAFLAGMSHELRTPLNSIIGFSGIMLAGLTGELSDEQHKQIGMINASGRHLLELVNDILDLSRIEAGRLEITTWEFDPAEIAEEVAQTIAPLAEEKGLDLAIEVEAGLPRVVSDHRRVEQVLLNLLGNAVKFTDQGRIALRVREEDGHVVFDVADTGCGVPPEHLTLIFDEFYRVPRPGHPTEEGSGLGLCVTKRLVESLGGGISVRSEPGQGSTFTVRLPVDAEGASGP